MKKEMNDFKLNSVKEIKCLSPEDNSEHIMKVCQKSKVELRRVLNFLMRTSRMWTLRSFSARVPPRQQT